MIVMAVLSTAIVVCPAADTTDAVAVVVEPAWTQPGRTVADAHACFSGEKLELSLRVFSSIGSRVELAGRLFQLTDELAAPVDELFVISTGLRFDETVRVVLSVTFAVPIVERRTRFELRLYSRNAADGNWRISGRAHLLAYPGGLLRELRSYGADTPIIVDDPGRTLTSTFERQEIAFVEPTPASLSATESMRSKRRKGARGRHGPAGLALRVVPGAAYPNAAEAEPDELETALLRKAYRVVRLQESAGPLAVVVIERRYEGVLARADLPHLESLSTSPATQVLLLDTIRRVMGAYEGET